MIVVPVEPKLNAGFLKAALLAGLSSLLLVLVFGHELQVPRQESDLRPFVGTYTGTLVESGSRDLVVTTIHSTQDHRLSGDYRVQQSTGAYVGSLEQRCPVHGDQVSFLWRDKYGIGTLDLAFEHGGNRFTGRWSADCMSAMSASDALPWVGSRK